MARQVATSRTMELIARFPQQFATITWKANFTFLPFDIQLIQKKHMELLGLMDLIISSWECQGFLMTGFGEGLRDIRCSFFTNMVPLIAWAQSIFPMFGYKSRSTTCWSSITLEKAAPTQCDTMRFLCASVV